MPGENKPLAAAAAVLSRLAGSGAHCSVRKAFAAPVAGDLPWDALPPDASIVVVRCARDSLMEMALILCRKQS